MITKARLCVRGDQETEKHLIPTDSPTVAKISIRILLLAAAKEKWELTASDVTSAFLQSTPIDREVLVRPPREANAPQGFVWRLKKTVYGLLDASRGFYKNFAENLVGLGMEVSRVDPAMFYFFDDDSTKDSEERNLSGIITTHVDDSLTGGNDIFTRKVAKPMMKKFKYGTHDSVPFRYVGFNVKKIGDSLCLDQDHYVKSLEEPRSFAINEKLDDLLNSYDQVSGSKTRNVVCHK